MKFNTTYTPSQSLTDTIKSVAYIKEELINAIKIKYNFIEIASPLFFEEDSKTIVDMNKVTRRVSFDFGEEYKVGVLPLTHTNWLRETIGKMELGYQEGLMTEAAYIWRDLENNPYSTPDKHEVTFQIKVKENESIELARTIVQDVYEYIYKLFIYVEEENNIQNIYPEFADYISVQQLHNEMPSETFKQRETDMIMRKNAFILEASGSKLFSGEVHTYIPPMLYDLKNFYQIVLTERVNSAAVKVASVSILSSGQQLIDQLHMYNLSDILSNEFYTNLSKDKDKIIEIKLNIPRIAMIILKKGHIGEVQSGVISDESKTISERHKIEII